MAFCQAIVRPNASNGSGREITALFIGMAARAFTEGAGTVVVLVRAGPRRLLGQCGTAVDNEFRLKQTTLTFTSVQVNALTGQNVDPEKLARELGVLKDWEAVSE